MDQSELLRLKRIEVNGLFGVYDHRINLDLDDRVTLLHGPNGVGKTSILRMTDAILRNNLARLKTIPFSRFMLEFHDGSTIELRVASNPKTDDGTHKLTLRNDNKLYSEVVSLGPSEAETIAAQIDWLRPHQSMVDTWIDLRDRELLTESDIISRFGDRDPNFRRHQKDMSWFSSFLENANAHLIEAQRLVRRPKDSKSSRSPRSLRFAHQPPIPSVVDCSEDFRKRLDDTMADYGRRSQILDQSFPQRLISATEKLAVNELQTEISTNELQTEMSTLDEKTARLKEVGILDATPIHPFDIGKLGDMNDSTQALVMTLYVHDTAEKLKVLDEFADRTRLFLDSVNAKYRHKKIRLDRQEGLVAVSDNDEPLVLDCLSSGEQHELVLHYDLLFRVPSNTIVLIDEPELSLHVAWQKRFLSDLVDIVEIASFDVLIATHSPFIVGDRDDLMVGLGDST